MSIKYQPKKIIEIPEIEFNRSVQGKYKTSVINPDGSVANENDWHKNLILDCGLDKIAYMPWAQVFQFCVAGNKPSGDVTAAAVTDTQLEQPLMMNSFYLPGSGNCGDELYQSGDYRYLRLFRTFDFLHVKQNTIVTELGFKETPGAKKLFSRVVLDGNTGVGRPDPELLRPGQFLRVKYELNVQLDPVTPNSTGIVPTGSDGNLPTISWSGAASSGDRHGLQHVGMVGINESGVAVPYDAGGASNEPFSVGAVDFGPGFGYVNRWQNGDGILQETGAAGNVIGYKQPSGTQKLADRPGPLLQLMDHQDMNRFINHESITGSGFVGNAFVNSHKNMSGQSATATNVSDLVSDASGYWPWGNYLRRQQLADFATAYSLSLGHVTSTSSTSYGYNRLFVTQNSLDYYSNTYRTPFFTYGPLSFVMRPVSRYGIENIFNNWDYFSPQNDSDATDANTNVDASNASYSHLHNLFATEIGTTTEMGSDHDSDLTKYSQYFNVADFYAPDQNSNVGSYLTFDEAITTRGFSSPEKSVLWDSWQMRGASCFLSTSTGAVQAFGDTGVAYDRSAGEDFFELPLRKAEYNTGQAGDSRSLFKFCFFDNAVANTITNGVRQHDAWKTIGVGATTDWSINPTTMSGAARDNGYVYRFDTAREKDNDHILKVSFKYTWTRNTGQL